MLSERISKAASELKGHCMEGVPLTREEMWLLLTHLQFWQTLALALERGQSGNRKTPRRPFKPEIVGGKNHQASPEASPEPEVIDDVQR